MIPFITVCHSADLMNGGRKLLSTQISCRLHCGVLVNALFKNKLRQRLQKRHSETFVPITARFYHEILKKNNCFYHRLYIKDGHRNPGVKHLTCHCLFFQLSHSEDTTHNSQAFLSATPMPKKSIK